MGKSTWYRPLSKSLHEAWYLITYLSNFFWYIMFHILNIWQENSFGTRNTSILIPYWFIQIVHERARQIIVDLFGTILYEFRVTGGCIDHARLDMIPDPYKMQKNFILHHKVDIYICVVSLKNILNFHKNPNFSIIRFLHACLKNK